MCGRYNITDSPLVHELMSGLGVDTSDWPVRFNNAPGEQASVVREGTLTDMRWKLQCAKDKTGKYANQCARHDKLLGWYRGEFTSRRCIIPMSGWYEWYGPRGGRQGRYIEPVGAACAMAGLWNESEGVLSAGIVTTDPHPNFEWVHNRMPLMLNTEEFDTWLTGDYKEAYELVQPKVIVDLSVIEVDRAVNNARNKDPELCTAGISDPVIIKKT